MDKDQLIELLGETLQDSQSHHDYCGWGDSWERECATQEGGLESRIGKALEAYENYKKEKV